MSRARKSTRMARLSVLLICRTFEALLTSMFTLVIQLSTSDPDVFSLIQKITVDPNSALVSIIDDTSK